MKNADNNNKNKQIKIIFYIRITMATGRSVTTVKPDKKKRAVKTFLQSLKRNIASYPIIQLENKHSTKMYYDLDISNLSYIFVLQRI